MSIVNHMGNLFSGHYVAYAKNSQDHQWRMFNDEEDVALECGSLCV